MSAFGFDDDVQLRVSMLVYLDLCEGYYHWQIAVDEKPEEFTAKGWADVRACGCDELGVIYLTAQEKPGKEDEIFHPIN